MLLVVIEIQLICSLVDLKNCQLKLKIQTLVTSTESTLSLCQRLTIQTRRPLFSFTCMAKEDQVLKMPITKLRVIKVTWLLYTLKVKVTINGITDHTQDGMYHLPQETNTSVCQIPPVCVMIVATPWVSARDAHGLLVTMMSSSWETWSTIWRTNTALMIRRFSLQDVVMAVSSLTISPNKCQRSSKDSSLRAPNPSPDTCPLQKL